MPSLHVRLFGKLVVHDGGRVLEGLDAYRAQELFCYLLLYRNHPHHRERLAELLWSDSPTVQARKYLRQALWQLQAALDAQPLSSRLLLAEADWVQLTAGDELWLDVAIFEHAFALVRGVRGQELDAQRAQAVREAVQLYQGDLLQGWYQDWCLRERERLQDMYLAMLDKLMEYAEVQGDYDAGVMYGALVMRYDHARERTHRQLMRLHYLSGNRTAAMRQYERCVAALRDELDVPPAQRTVQLYEQIRADELDASPAPIARTAPVSDATVARLLEAFNYLRQLQTVLDEVQRQVRQDVQVIQESLSSRR
jgi:DNA-binding SARP family transcriptional activator